MQALISIVAASCCLCMSVSPTSPKSIHTLSHPDETGRVIVLYKCDWTQHRTNDFGSEKPFRLMYNVFSKIIES